jgi:general secretion pathway protein D
VLRNTVLVENNKTVVLGGLIDTNVIDSVTKVPILGDIPGLGWLFKRTSSQERKTNLLVFINPTIIKSPGDLDRVTSRNRRAASGFVTDKLRGAMPENFFIGLEDPDSVVPENAAEMETGSEAAGGAADMATPVQDQAGSE